MSARRVMIIGLDCATPEMVFERFRGDMPVLSGLMETGSWGRLRSTMPPITVPAWACMVTGRDPGQLGIYGFRQRQPGSYRLRLVTASDIRCPRVWDFIGDAGKQVAVLFVPPSYPPFKVKGQMVSCFLTPGPDSPHTFPPSLQQELSARFGPGLMDVSDLRADKTVLLERLRVMADQHFSIARYIWQSRHPDFLMMVEIGIDRLQHAFWQDLDPDHPDYIPQNPFEEPCRRYFADIDSRIGEMCSLAGPDTAVLVVSDHGARAMQGAVRVNEWLAELGYLVLARRPDRVTAFDELEVDWSRTRAWGEGGYYARIFLNVQGREPQGVIPRADYPRECETLKSLLGAVPGPGGKSIDNLVISPRESYREVNGFPPDLCVFLGDLSYRAIGSMGHGAVYARHGDSGPDGCNHDWDGILVMSGAGVPRRGQVQGYQIYDVASTVLGLMDLPIPGDLIGVDRSR